MKLLSRATTFFSLFLPLTVLAVGPCVDINTVPEEELEKIKHIGTARAKQLVELRTEKPFSSLAELDRLIGIGPSRVSDIINQGLACVLGEPNVKTKINQEARPTTSSPIASADLKEGLAEIKPDKPLSSLTLLLTALIIAIFSGFAILFLKRKAKN